MTYIIIYCVPFKCNSVESSRSKRFKTESKLDWNETHLPTESTAKLPCCFCIGKNEIKVYILNIELKILLKFEMEIQFIPVILTTDISNYCLSQTE